MKIFALFSSPKGEASQGYQLIKKLIDEIKLNGGIISEVNCYHANNLQILPSNGDESVFINGIDILDKEDNFDQVKLKLQESDLIILGSPVYAQNVSAHMKIFIERISQYAHNFGLAGKLSYVITSSYSNGNELVYDYIQSTLNYMGVVAAGRMDLIIRFQSTEKIQKKLSVDAKKIVAMFNDSNNITFNTNQEKIYTKMCELYKKFGNEDRYLNEYQSYQRRGLFKTSSFQEFFLENFNKEKNNGSFRSIH